MLDRTRSSVPAGRRRHLLAAAVLVLLGQPVAAAESSVTLVVDRSSGPARVEYCWAGDAGKDPGEAPKPSVAGQPASPREFGLGDLLSLKVSNLASVTGADNERCGELRLALSRNIFTAPRPFGCDPASGTVTFNLERIPQAAEGPWSTLLDSRRWVTASVDVSIADGDEILPTEARGQRLKLYNKRFAWYAIGGLVLVLIGFFYLARNSQMLRDRGGSGEPLRTFSLARTQTAWWFLIIVGSFLFLSLLVGETVTIPPSALGLMGISAGTVVGAKLVEGGQGAAAMARPRKPDFWYDILADETGVGFHRFQMVVWTAALGIIFILRVFKNLAMPEFDATLLGLMGISNGTYLGMKIPEQRAAAGS